MTYDVRQTCRSGNDWVSVKGSSDGELNVIAEMAQAHLGPFSDLIVVSMTPQVQVDFVYGINTQQGAVTINTTGVGDADSGRLRLQTGTGSAGSASYASRRTGQYRPGQGTIARLTLPFTTPVANSTQIAGVGSTENGYFFGANGASTGVLHRNASSDTWIAQTAWNGDRCDGTNDKVTNPSGYNWDVTKGIPAMIMYPYLGYGNVTYWLQDPDTGRWILCHTIKYAGTSATVQVRNPDLGVFAEVKNNGNTSNLTMFIGSAAIFLCGEHSLVGKPKWAADSNVTTVTTAVGLLTLKNATSFNGLTNRVGAKVNSVSVSSTSNNGIATLRFKLNSTLGGSPSYAAISGTTGDGGVTITSGQSALSVDKAGTTVTGGTYIFSLNIGSPGNQTLDVRDHQIVIPPGETLTLEGSSTASTTLGVAINWTEDI